MLFLILLIIIVILAVRCVKVVQQSEAYVIERMGSYFQTWNNGIHFKVPFIDNIVNKISLKEHVMDLPAQSVITKDNVSMNIDTVMAIEITDPKLATYGVDNLENALEKSVGTALRNVVGELELDQTLSERDSINAKMQNYMDEVTGKWGVKVNRVELKNITPPQAIQEAMEKQMKAERERREAILRAEGEKKSTVLVAEGKKESAILEAEAEKQAAILRAEARREAMIKEAEGQAEAIKQVQQANADGLRFLKEAAPDNAVLQLKSLEAFAKASDGKATKIIIPSEIQSIAGLVKSMAEVAETDTKA